MVVRGLVVDDQAAAYLRHLPEISAIPRVQFIAVNIDIDAVLTKGMAALVRVRAFRSAMLALVGIDRRMVENCETYLLALGGAHAKYRAASADGEVVEASRLRQAAFTLFVRAYEEVRRATQYLRYHERDAEKYAPSLYSRRVGRGRRKKRKDDRSRVGAEGDACGASLQSGSLERELSLQAPVSESSWLTGRPQ